MKRTRIFRGAARVGRAWTAVASRKVAWIFCGLAAAVSCVPAPVAAQPRVTATFTGGNVELRWPQSPNFSAQIEGTLNLTAWRQAGLPVPAPPAPGFATNVFPIAQTQTWFRVRYDLLTNSPVPTAPGNYGGLSFVSGQIARSYRLVIPTNYTGSLPAPLAFMLHGGGMTADSFAGLHPALRSIAGEAGLILVFPQSVEAEEGTRWTTLDPVPGEPYVDDVRFLLELLDHLGAALNLDRQRVYAGGFSNGGVFAHYLGGRTTNVFAALAAVASAIANAPDGTNLVYMPRPAAPMPVLIVNATNDCARPYWGGPSDRGGLQPAAAEAADHWTTNLNACLNAPLVTTNYHVLPWFDRPDYERDCPNANPASGMVTNLIIRSTWLGCSNSVEVSFVTLTDGGHLWPDAGDNVGFDANREVLEFFLRHCRCEAPGATPWLTIPTTPGQYDRAFCDQGYWRKFRLMIPAAYTGAADTPLVFAFHGGEETAAGFSAQHLGLFAKCNGEGLLLVLPEATKHPTTFDTLWGNRDVEIVVDDRAFVTNLLEKLDAVLAVDRKKVYAAGFSSGGRFGFWMGATSPGVLAAIGSVCAMTGWVDRQTLALVAPPAPAEPVPVLMVRGSLDPRVPFGGGPNNAGQLTFSAADDLAYWVSGSGCAPPATTNTVGVLTSVTYTPCFNSTEVRLDAVGGMGHIWPEGAAYNASIQVIDFLLRFTRP